MMHAASHIDISPPKRGGGAIFAALNLKSSSGDKILPLHQITKHLDPATCDTADSGLPEDDGSSSASSSPIPCPYAPRLACIVEPEMTDSDLDELGSFKLPPLDCEEDEKNENELADEKALLPATECASFPPPQTKPLLDTPPMTMGLDEFTLDGGWAGSFVGGDKPEIMMSPPAFRAGPIVSNIMSDMRRFPDCDDMTCGLTDSVGCMSPLGSFAVGTPTPTALVPVVATSPCMTADNARR